MEWPQRYILIWSYLLCGYGNIECNTNSKELKVAKQMCLLKPDVGPCRADIEMYFFHSARKNCSTFKWGGCQGNGNRFDTQRECLDTCLGKRPKRPTYCGLRFDYGFCFGEDKRWYYDAKWGVCRETIYSGCGGNKNNFYAKEVCEAICRFGHGKKIFEKPKDDSVPLNALTNNMTITEDVPMIWQNQEDPQEEEEDLAFV